MGKSKIQWTDMTWPVVTGCSHAGSPGCDFCYAARMAATRLKHHPRYAGLATISDGKARWTGEVRLNHDVLEQPLHWRKPRMIFVASMGDLFHPNVPPQFIKEVWHVMMDCPRCTFQVLTKQAKRMMMFLNGWYTVDTEFQNLPKNIWLGVSVENQAAADKRVPLLLQTPAAVRFVSVEPMLEAVDLSRYFHMFPPDKRIGVRPRNIPAKYKPLHWVICGGESSPGARPMHPDWARSLRDQCQAAGTPYFFKQHGAWLHGSQFPLKSPWAELRRDGARVHGHPANWHYESDRTYHWPDGSTSYRIGKKRAGHLLDRRAWQEFPQTDAQTGERP